MNNPDQGAPALKALAGDWDGRTYVWPVRVYYHHTDAGGVVCPSCQPAARDRRPLSAPAWAALKALRPDSTAPREPVSPLPPAGRREVRQVLGQTVGFVLGRRPRMLSYLDGT